MDNIKESDKVTEAQTIRSRLALLEKEKEELTQNLVKLETKVNNHLVQYKGQIAHCESIDSSENKIVLFLELFAGRPDVYAKRWESKQKGISGYSPACRNEWIKGICLKPKTKCVDCHHRSFYLLDEYAIKAHLEGRIVLGTYAILLDDSCKFLAVDFDGVDWLKDITAFLNAAAEMEIQVAIERSRSGNGGHAWIFFSEAVQARVARQLGTIILSRAMRNRSSLKLESFDRFFPNQDVLPKGGFGNLIGLPLQREARTKENSIFIKIDGGPVANQWEFLSQCHRLSINDVDKLIAEFGLVTTKDASLDEEVRVAENSIDQASTGIDGILSGVNIRMELGAMLRIPLNNLSAKIVSAFKRTSIFANPKFFELQRLRFSTWKTPRYISCSEYNGTDLLLPRGCIEKVVDIVVQACGNVSIIDKRIENSIPKVEFLGELTKEQSIAVDALKKHEIGVLVAPPGAGKTVMACNLIAFLSQKTLVITHRKQLVDQWKLRLEKFLKLEELFKFINVKMIQTLARRVMDSPSGEEKYGLIIVDECHHIPAVSFEAILKRFNAKYVIGLTATPYRKDGLHPIIHMQCGPIRHEMKDLERTVSDRTVIFKQTDFKPNVDVMSQEPIYLVWERMINSKTRNELIAKDVVEVLRQGRIPLILSDRKDHIDLLLELINMEASGLNAKGFALIGDMGKKSRKKVLEDIEKCFCSKTPLFLIATSSFIGEGFDLPALDTLFLTMPVSFKGRIIQYAGRIHRISPDKNNVIIYDYFDKHLPLTISMFRKRIITYRKMGYAFDMSGLDDPQRWINVRKKR